MEWIKSYTLTPEQQAEVDAKLAEYKEKYKDIAHIVMEGRPLTEEELHQCGYYDLDEDEK